MAFMESKSAPLDLDRYLARIHYAEPVSLTVETFQALHFAHATQIPFENVDALLGRPIRLDIPSLEDKLVTSSRGGYCFEQNLLFAAALEQIGFVVTRLAARVRYRTTRLLPRTHMLLKVDIGAGSWIADVGFGGEGLLAPVPLIADAPAQQFAWTYRVVREQNDWVLQSKHGPTWHDLYQFTLEPQHLVDFEMANYYVSTNPQSRFVQTLTAQRPLPEVRYALRNRELLTERPNDSVEVTRLADDDEVLRVLAEMFNLHFPAGTRFPIQTHSPDLV